MKNKKPTVKLNPKQESKLCAYCHRPFTNRKKWQRRGIWGEVKYCSKKCRAAAKKA